MKEEEAKKKWCPWARVSTLVTGVDFNESPVGGAACNRPPKGDSTMNDDALCIASDCMMWFWDEWMLDKNQRVTTEGCSGHCGLTDRR